MKNKIFLAAILGAASAAAPSAHAQILNFSGVNSVSLEGGLSIALNNSSASLIVVNNVGTAPWATTELVSADVLDFGLGASFGLQANFGLDSGASIYLRSSGNWAEGSVDISGLFAVTGAIPGIHDDGYLISNAWSPIATVTTQTLDAAIGFQTAAYGGINYFAGVIYGDVSQDISVDFTISSFAPPPTVVAVSGVSTNTMYGAEMGVAYSHAFSNKLSILLSAGLAALDNNFTYTYQHESVTGASTTTNIHTATGHSTVVRSEVSAQLAYASSERISLTGKIGLVNYSNVSTGVENTLNPNNTTAAITPVYGSVMVPYVRAGVRIAF